MVVFSMPLFRFLIWTFVVPSISNSAPITVTNFGVFTWWISMLWVDGFFNVFLFLLHFVSSEGHRHQFGPTYGSKMALLATCLAHEALCQYVALVTSVGH